MELHLLVGPQIRHPLGLLVLLLLLLLLLQLMRPNARAGVP